MRSSAQTVHLHRTAPVQRAAVSGDCVDIGKQLLRLDLGGAVDDDSQRTVVVVMKEQNDGFSEKIAAAMFNIHIGVD